MSYLFILPPRCIFHVISMCAVCVTFVIASTCTNESIELALVQYFFSQKVCASRAKIMNAVKCELNTISLQHEIQSTAQFNIQSIEFNVHHISLLWNERVALTDCTIFDGLRCCCMLKHKTFALLFLPFFKLFFQRRKQIKCKIC